MKCQKRVSIAVFGVSIKLNRHGDNGTSLNDNRRTQRGHQFESERFVHLGLFFLQPSQSFTNPVEEMDKTAEARKQAALELSGPSLPMTATDTRHVLLRVGGQAGAD